MDLVKAAMDVGVGGGTISKLKYNGAKKSESREIPPVREICQMCISENQILRKIGFIC